MDHTNNNDNDNPPGQQQQPLSNSLSRISFVSDITDSSFYGAADDAQDALPLRGHPSLVSLESSHNEGDEDGDRDRYQTRQPDHDDDAGGHTYGAPRSGWSSLAGSAGGGAYEQVASAPARTPSRSFGARAASIRQRQQRHETIPEEERADYDNYAEGGEDDDDDDDDDGRGLVRSAAPMGTTTGTRTVGHEEREDDIDRGHHHGGNPAYFDLTSALGPSTRQDEEFIRKLQAQEASGVLTGGLGQGIRTESTTVITESALLAAAAAAATTTGPVEGINKNQAAALRPTFSISRRRSRLSRSATLKQLAQSEANKRGEVIEVILEEEEGEGEEGGKKVEGAKEEEEEGKGEDEDEDEDEEERLKRTVERSNVDLSVMTGPNTIATSRLGIQDSIIPMRRQKSEVFYPQPDWKPISMRWPYLMALVVLSMGLAGAQEILYQTSLRRPLVTFRSPSEIPPAEYFAIKFLPTIVTVSYGVLWQITDFEVRRLEAFYQLSREGGALASESLNVDYITNFNFLRPYRALRCRHYAVFVSSVATLLATALVPTLGAAAIYLAPDQATRLREPDGEKQILVSAVWSRFLTAALLLVALLGCVLFCQLRLRRSGLLSDPLGIAGLASMAVVSHILMDFKGLDLASHREIHDRLKDHRYMLRNSSLAPDDGNIHINSGGNSKSPTKHESSDSSSSSSSLNPSATFSSRTTTTPKTTTTTTKSAHPLMLRAAGCVPFVAGIALFLGLLPTVLFTQANVLTERAPWLVTALAVCIKLCWASLETDVRVLQPYYLLWRRHAAPRTLALDYTALPFGWVAVRAALNGHALVALVGLGSVFAEVLTVLVTSLATVEGRDFIVNVNSTTTTTTTGADGDENINAGEETLASFWATLALAVFILLYMACVASLAFARRRRVFLPRQPTTVASVLAFIHQSRMLYDFVGTAKLSNAGMAARLDSLAGDYENGGKGKTYGLGWFRGRDGLPHCGVDEEELLSGYNSGYDYAMATRPWEDGGEEFM